MKKTSIHIILRAMMAGAVGGVLAAVFAVTIGERSINAAIAIEEAGLPAGSGAEAAPLVSRSVQAYIGLPIAGILFGAFAGLVFGTVFASIRHRLPGSDDFRRSLALAAIAFVAIVFVPAMKYPANPPAVGDPATVGQRSIYYFSLVAAGIVLAVGISIFRTWCRNQFDQSLATAVTLVGGIVAYIALILIWPNSPDTVPADFPATLLWEFRLQSLTSLALLFSGLGVGLGVLLTRSDKGAAGASSSP